MLAICSLSAQNQIIDSVLYIAEGTTKIADKAYKGNCDFNTVVIPSSVKTIGVSTFQNSSNLKKIVIPGNVKKIGDNAFAGCANLEEVVMEEGVETICLYAFYNCPKLNSVTMPLSLQKIVPDGLYWENKSTRVFHCYAGSAAYNLAQKNNYQTDIIDVDKQCADSITELNFSGNTVINQLSAECANVQTIKLGLNVEKIAAEVFRKYPVARIDLNNDLAEIGENAFNDETMLRVKRNTYADTWAKENGYYLCGVLADLNIYTKDASKQIEEDFTRILCDDSPYSEWTKSSFNTQQPLKLEEIDGKLVLTSYMLYPCENVTVTDKDGNSLINDKTIYPLTRTMLCDFNYRTDSVEKYTLTCTDTFYNRLVSIPINWNISFNRIIRRISSDNSYETMRPVYVREYIAGIYNVADIIGSVEYERRCFEAVENKTLVTDSALTVPLTKEQMENLLKKTKEWTLVLGRDNLGGLGGGSILTLARDFIIGLSQGKPNAFWHEFSHCMGWAHEQGNMCNEGRPKPYNVDWPSIGSLLYQEEYKKGNSPYMIDNTFFNSYFFSRAELLPEDMPDDIIQNDTLYIAEELPRTGSHEKQTNFTKVIIPSSVEIVDEKAFYSTKIDSVNLSSNVKTICKNAFSSCEELNSVTIPNSVKEIGDAAFQNCTSLTSVEIPNSLREISYRLFKGSGLTEIVIPGTIDVIGNEAFADCQNLKTVVIEDGVRKIDNNAFYNTEIDTIEVPESVTILGKNITSKGVVWKVKYGSAAYYAALENNYPIALLPEPMENIATQIIADSENAEAASTEGWQTDDFTSSYERRTWDFSNELKGAGTYTITFKYTGGSNMLCLADALFTADGNPVGFVAERRTAGINPKQIVYEITVPDGTENLMFYALAKTDGGTNSKGTISISYQPSNNGENGNNNGDDNGNGNGDDNGDTETSVNELHTEINIYAINRTIVVENATDEILVYDVMGRLVCRDATPCVRTEIPLEKSGVYIVKIGNLSKKVIIE